MKLQWMKDNKTKLRRIHSSLTGFTKCEDKSYSAMRECFPTIQKRVKQGATDGEVALELFLETF